MVCVGSICLSMAGCPPPASHSSTVCHPVPGFNCGLQAMPGGSTGRWSITARPSTRSASGTRDSPILATMPPTSPGDATAIDDAETRRYLDVSRKLSVTAERRTASFPPQDGPPGQPAPPRRLRACKGKLVCVSHADGLSGLCRSTGNDPHQADQPPSTVRFCPVIRRPASVASYSGRWC